MEKATVFVYVEGGVVQHVVVPRNTIVIVRDYDTEGETDHLKTDEQGERFVEATWHNEADGE